MDIYIYVDDDGLEEQGQALASSMALWITESQSPAVLVNTLPDSEAAVQVLNAPASTLGIHLGIRKGRELKEPLNQLYTLAKQYQCEFVLGVNHEPGQGREPICYFGHEEGRPDVYEISSYLGVKV